MEGGEIGLYVLAQSTLAASDPKFNNTPEYIITELRNKSHILLIAVVYIRPNAASPTKFFETIPLFLAAHRNIIIILAISTPTYDHLAHLTLAHKSELVKSHALAFVYQKITHASSISQ